MKTSVEEWKLLVRWSLFILLYKFFDVFKSFDLSRVLHEFVVYLRGRLLSVKFFPSSRIVTALYVSSFFLPLCKCSIQQVYITSAKGLQHPKSSWSAYHPVFIIDYDEVTFPNIHFFHSLTEVLITRHHVRQVSILLTVAFQIKEKRPRKSLLCMIFSGHIVFPVYRGVKYY